MSLQNSEVATPQIWPELDLALRILYADEERHRLANNLQLVVNNLDRCAKTISSQAAAHALSYASEQIVVLARLHSMLYRPDRSGEIACHRYVLDLCSFIEVLISAPRGHTLTVRATPEADVAIAEARQMHLLGLMIYELVINAVKHAFPMHAAGSIDLEIALVDDVILCTISDDGLGLASATGSTDSRGMQYVTAWLRRRAAHAPGTSAHAAHAPKSDFHYVTRQKKQFFFEKKNQKTFAPLRAAPAGQRRIWVTDKSFLVLFFKKELLLLRLA